MKTAAGRAGRTEQSHPWPPYSMLFLLLLITGCGDRTETAIRTPRIDSAEFVGNKACESCHGRLTGVFASSPHGQFHGEWSGVEKSGETGCESCHGPGSLHVATGGQTKGLIVNPGKDPSACLNCHISQHSEFQFPYHHPVIEGRMNCVDCHEPHGPDIFRPAGGPVVRTTREFCGRCHPAQSRPYIFEHAGMVDGCQTCHEPHGAPNRKMLTAPGPNLCLRCHAQVAGPASPSGTLSIGAVDHSSFVSQGTCWSSGCHTAVHGSNIHPALLY